MKNNEGFTHELILLVLLVLALIGVVLFSVQSQRSQNPQQVEASQKDFAEWNDELENMKEVYSQQTSEE